MDQVICISTLSHGSDYLRMVDKTIDITIDASQVPIGETRHAEIIFRGTQSSVLTFPVTIVRRQADITLRSNMCTNIT